MNIRIILALIFLIPSVVLSQTLTTVDTVDLNRYMGLWYEIASFPAPFQKGCRCSTAEYSPGTDNKTVHIMNRCIRFKNNRSKMIHAKARAFAVKGSGNSKLKVQFIWPFRGDYYIIGLAQDYSWAIVGEPKRKYLWILSRDSFMPAHTYNEIIAVIRSKGYDTGRITKSPRNCDIPE